jgi:hypothetical protein
MLAQADLSQESPLLPSRWYAPLQDEPALFRTFAYTPATKEGILEFASRFGMLGSPAEVGTDLPPIMDQSGFCCCVTAEPLAAWMAQIFSMRQAVGLWDMAIARDVAGLAELIFCRGDAVQYQPKPAWFLPTRVAEEPPEDGGEWLEAAQPLILHRDHWSVEYFWRLPNVALVEAAVVAVEAIANRHLQDAASIRLVADLGTGCPAVRHVPGSLAGALWLQFAEAASARKRFRTCKECGRWFEIPLRGARISREYCSNACRSRAYRGRQERARQLYAEGKSFKEIAREFDTDVRTVKKWVASSKE